MKVIVSEVPSIFEAADTFKGKRCPRRSYPQWYVLVGQRAEFGRICPSKPYEHLFESVSRKRGAKRWDKLITLPNSISPYEKKFIQTNEPFFITLLISSFQSK